MEGVKDFGTVDVDIKRYKDYYKPLLEKAAQLSVTNPNGDDETDPVEVANAMNMISVFMEQQLTNEVPKIKELEDKVALLDSQLRRVQTTNAQLSSQVFAATQKMLQRDAKPQDENEILSYDQIKAKMAI